MLIFYLILTSTVENGAAKEASAIVKDIPIFAYFKAEVSLAPSPHIPTFLLFI
jgi:hypothetical protein